MEFNRLITLVLGFVVLILVFVWISNRFRASTRTADGRTPTITPTYTPTPSTPQDTTRGWNPFGFLTRDNNSPTPTKKTSPIPTAVKVKVETTGATTTAKITQAPSKMPTKSPTKVVAQKPSGNTQKQPAYTNNKTGKTLTQIPETGAPTALLSIMLAGLSGGIYLRRKV